MFIVIAPISGKQFPLQIWEMLEFMKLYKDYYNKKPFAEKACQLDKMPNKILAASGGVIAMYITSVADYDENKIDVEFLNSEKILKFSVISKSMYKVVGLEPIYDKTPYTTDVIVGTYDTITHSPIRITNSHHLMNENVIYWEKNKFIHAMIASMSIPFLFRSISIDSYNLVDGGVGEPSPFSVINNESLFENETLKMVYLESNNLNEPYSIGYQDLIMSLYRMEKISVINAFKHYCAVKQLKCKCEKVKSSIMNIISRDNFLIFVSCETKNYKFSLTSFNEKTIRDTKKSITSFIYECYYT